MLFHSWQFAIFFPIVFLSYFLVPHKYRYLVLLAASYYFYMSWNPKLIALIGFVTLVTYAAARLVSTPSGLSNRSRRAVLICGVSLPLIVLFFFKYFNFFSSELNTLLQAISIPLSSPALDLILPMGISFYTFQALSYVIDVYRGSIQAEKHLGYYALYISFFPQLVAGPIERSQNLLPQFHEVHHFDCDNAIHGLQRMAIGFFKKLVIADLIAIRIDVIFGHVTGFYGFPLLLSTVLFAIQIYCDFSGYSDIAIGCAQMMGFRLMENFKSPYFSLSIREFWHRWHISLSSWFSDYVYIPLGGSRVRLPRHLLNLLITFAISGLWHGAGRNFIIWGLLHGIYLCCGVLFRKISFPKRITALMNQPAAVVLRTLLTFSLCCIAWVFFRTETVADALHVLRYSLQGLGAPLRYLVKDFGAMNFRIDSLVKIVIGVGILFTYDGLNQRDDLLARLNRLPKLPRYAIMVGFVLLIILFSNKGIPSEFIYFQF